MPNKQKRHQRQDRPFRTTTARFAANPHPSLSLSRPDPRTQHTPDTGGRSSVEDCLRSLRKEEAKRLPLRPPPVATVHPSLRNLLDVPETLQPRPRPGGLRIPGPAAPPSWQLLRSPDLVSSELEQSPDDTFSTSTTCLTSGRHVLPGAQFPPKGSLLHMTLRAIAKRWHWHLEHDSFDLVSIPVHLREVLLSYVASHCPDDSLRKASTTLRVLFPDPKDLGPGKADHEVLWVDAEEIQRLDLGRALGTWLHRTSSLKRQLLGQHIPQGATSLNSQSIPAGDAREATDLPESWEDSASAPSDFIKQRLSFAPLYESPPLKFQHLLHLSLSLSPVIPACPSVASWPSLLSLAPHLSTLQSLSLAYWPSPTLTPYAAAISATIRNPVSRALPTITYGGTDKYTESESNWREAAGILKKLSRHLYCLRWLDLTGCGLWFGALSWRDSDVADDMLDSGAQQVHAGPEWNGSWRNVEYLGLSVGWSAQGYLNENSPSTVPSDPDLSTKIEGSATSTGRGVITQDWDVEEERRKYFAKRELERHRAIQSRAREVTRSLRTLRAEARGKWIQVYQ